MFAVRILARSMMGLSLSVMAADSTGFDPGVFLNAGAIGLFTLAYFTDRIVNKSQLDRALAERDKAEAQRDDLIRSQQEKVIPLLEGIQQRLLPVMEKVIDRLDEDRRQPRSDR